MHEVLDLVARNHEGPVIVPMTLIDPLYFAEIVGRLRDDGHDVRHFALLAERATVLRRLNGRGFGFGLRREQWASGRRWTTPLIAAASRDKPAAHPLRLTPRG